jgi:hypothetical protein
MKSIYAGKLQALTSSAAKIYIEIDIPKVKKYHARSYPIFTSLKL